MIKRPAHYQKFQLYEHPCFSSFTNHVASGRDRRAWAARVDRMVSNREHYNDRK